MSEYNEENERLIRMMTAATEHFPKNHEMAGQVKYYLVPPAIMESALRTLKQMGGSQ